ncbi:MAG: aspartate aminotransferase family protein [Gammaproteobacteria bacterium]|nr:aspartate aminotransferase family protein [Gammaproteobacteria bacterium]
MSSLMHSYNRLSFKPAYGKGAWVFDEQGNKCLDALGGIAVCALGHAHEAVSQAICDQSKRLMHTSNLYQVPAQEELGDKLCKVAQMDSAFICNSGAEANEAAIKLARLYASKRAIKNPQIVVMEGAFHGRTMATLTATGNRKIQAGFEPLVQGFLRAPYGDIEALKQIASNSKDVVAVLLEPIQGEGGIIVPPTDYLAKVREICDEHEWLMMLDEIQTGIGRTGAWFAWMHENARPDVLTSAKALGNGFPIGACLASGQAAELIQPGSHGTTFGGNPLACTVANTVLDEIISKDYVKRAGELGKHIQKALWSRLGTNPGVMTIRGKGLMIGIQLDRNCGALMQQGIDNGILINVTANKVIRLLPPYILTDDEAEQLIERVSRLVLDFLD